MTELEELQRICAEWLDNANLAEIAVSSDGRILLKFVVGGTADSLHWIDIECQGIHVLHLAKDWEEEFASWPFVGEAKVKKFDDENAIMTEIYKAGFYVRHEGPWPSQLYEFQIEGGISIYIICTELNAQERDEKLSSAQ
jgi:hypothetical protein